MQFRIVRVIYIITEKTIQNMHMQINNIYLLNKTKYFKLVNL